MLRKQYTTQPCLRRECGRLRQALTKEARPTRRTHKSTPRYSRLKRQSWGACAFHLFASIVVLGPFRTNTRRVRRIAQREDVAKSRARCQTVRLPQLQENQKPPSRQTCEARSRIPCESSTLEPAQHQTVKLCTLSSAASIRDRASASAT